MAEESNIVTAAEIERIVREVLAQLAGEKNSEETAKAEPKLAGSRTLSERLVTLAALNGNLEGVTELIVPQRAVVTPAVAID